MMIANPPVDTRRGRGSRLETSALRHDTRVRGGHVRFAGCGYIYDHEGLGIEPRLLAREQLFRDRAREHPLVRSHPRIAVFGSHPEVAREERHLATGRIERVLTRARDVLDRRRARFGEALAAPQEDPELRDVVPAASRAPAAEIRRVEVLVERGARTLRGSRVTKIGKASHWRPTPRAAEAVDDRSSAIESDRRIEPVACPPQPAEELHDADVPVRDVGGDLLEDRDGAFAPGVVN